MCHLCRDKARCLHVRTVSSCVSDKEYAAIVEFANQYGETMSSAIKKAIFDVAALTNEDSPSGYMLKLEEPEGKDEYGNSLGDVLFSDNIDKVREIAGLPELDLFGYKRKRKEGKPSDAKQSNEQEQGKKEWIDRADKAIEEKFQDKADNIIKLFEDYGKYKRSSQY